jgi:hypothetical protein
VTIETIKTAFTNPTPWNPPNVQNKIKFNLPKSVWPEPMGPKAYHGVAGELVRIIEPHTEADSAALLIQFLVAFGNCIDQGPHFLAEADEHHFNLFAVLVGDSSKGRKGTSWGHIERLFKVLRKSWSEACIHSGLSSGEGLIWAVRDAIEKTEPIKVKGKVTGYQQIITDPGVTDKRALILEAEFASTLRVLGREGNTLSPIIRNAWDGKNLETMTKNNQAKATKPHISMIAHITKDELNRYLGDAEKGNGFANRFLWVCVKRSKYLPEGGRLKDSDLDPIIKKLGDVFYFADSASEIKRDDNARKLWIQIYNKLSKGNPGLSGAVTSRAEAQVMRLACLYAVLDQSNFIRVEHLRAGLEVWKYTEASAKYIFGDSSGDPVVDNISSALKCAIDGLTQTEINQLFKGHKKGADISRGLNVLLQSGKVIITQEKTAGRTSTRYFWNTEQVN